MDGFSQIFDLTGKLPLLPVPPRGSARLRPVVWLPMGPR